MTKPVSRSAPVRGRPRQFDRDRALDIALQTFWQHGYEGTSVADLTTALNIGAPSLYAAFGSKAKLFEAAVQRYVTGAGSFLMCSLAEEPSARASIERGLRDAALAFTKRGSPRGCLIQTALLGWAEENEAPARFVADLRRRSRGAIAQRLERGVQEGELSADTDVEALAAYCVALIQGLSVQARDGASRAELNAIIDIAMKSFPG